MAFDYDKLVRFVLAVILLFFAVDHFFQLLPTILLNDNAIVFLQALERTGYVLHIYAINQFISATLFLLNRFVTLASLLILPGSINLLMFNILLDRTGLLIALLICGLLAAIIYKRKENYVSIFKQ